MKLPQFLKTVDEYTRGMIHEELERFIHEIARTLPEEERGVFLDTLENSKGGGLTGENGFSQREDFQDVSSEAGNMIKVLENINSGKRRLNSEYNEEWDDWYDSDDDEILFSDPDGVLRDIDRATEVIHQCVDMNLYQEGCRLSETLCYLEVSVDGDYVEFDGGSLGIEELYEHNLLEGSAENFATECLYLTYMGSRLSDRPEELFGLFQKFKWHETKLEDVLQAGNRELPEFDQFLTLWITFLGGQSGGIAEKLLREAQQLLQDDSARLENARRFVKEHPALYLQLLEMKKDSGEESKTLEIGLEALERIQKNLRVRGQAALCAADHADRLRQSDVRDQCWLEAFRSDTTVLNYLRVRFLSDHAEQYHQEIVRIIREPCRKKDSGSIFPFDREYPENRISQNEFCALMFFEQQFEIMEQTGMNIKEPLGWSSTFMKEGISLLLLMLYQGGTYSGGMKAMADRSISACGFSAEKYYREMRKDDRKDDAETFRIILEKWKESVSLSEQEEEAWIRKTDSLIRKRTRGIMDANKRNYYGECAAFIAAYGEMLESRGERGAKYRIMDLYKKEYSRRSAFHKELRSFGMV